MIENERTREDRELAMICGALMQTAVAEMPGKDVFVLDCNTMEITRFDIDRKENV